MVEGSLSLAQLLELVLALTMASNWDEEEVARPTVNIYDGPQPYNFEPFRRERANEEIPRADGRQRQINAWSEENDWRVGGVSW